MEVKIRIVIDGKLNKKEARVKIKRNEFRIKKINDEIIRPEIYKGRKRILLEYLCEFFKEKVINKRRIRFEKFSHAFTFNKYTTFIDLNVRIYEEDLKKIIRKAIEIYGNGRNMIKAIKDIFKKYFNIIASDDSIKNPDSIKIKRLKSLYKI